MSQCSFIVSNDFFYSLGFKDAFERNGLNIELLKIEEFLENPPTDSMVFIDLVSWEVTISSDAVINDSAKKAFSKSIFISANKRHDAALRLMFDNHVKVKRDYSIDQMQELIIKVQSNNSFTNVNRLTIREYDILLMRSKGIPVKRIASNLDINIKTVYAHLHSSLYKSDFRNMCCLYRVVQPFAMALH